MTLMRRSSQDNFCGKNSWKSVKYSQSYDFVCHMALLGGKGLTLDIRSKAVAIDDCLSLFATVHHYLLFAIHDYSLFGFSRHPYNVPLYNILTDPAPNSGGYCST